MAEAMSHHIEAHETTAASGTLADVFAKVQVTPAEGAAILQGMIRDMRDQNPELHDKIMKVATGG